MNAHRNSVIFCKIAFCISPYQLVELKKTAAIKRIIHNVCNCWCFSWSTIHHIIDTTSVSECAFIELNFIVDFIFYLYSRPCFVQHQTLKTASILAPLKYCEEVSLQDHFCNGLLIFSLYHPPVIPLSYKDSLIKSLHFTLMVGLTKTEILSRHKTAQMTLQL